MEDRPIVEPHISEKGSLTVSIHIASAKRVAWTPRYLVLTTAATLLPMYPHFQPELLL